MPSSYHVRITPRALEDLEEIFAYINHDSPHYARSMIKTLLDAIDSLDVLPYRYPTPRANLALGPM